MSTAPLSLAGEIAPVLCPQEVGDVRHADRDLVEVDLEVVGERTRATSACSRASDVSGPFRNGCSYAPAMHASPQTVT